MWGTGTISFLFPPFFATLSNYTKINLCDNFHLLRVSFLCVWHLQIHFSCVHLKGLWTCKETGNLKESRHLVTLLMDYLLGSTLWKSVLRGCRWLSENLIICTGNTKQTERDWLLAFRKTKWEWNNSNSPSTAVTPQWAAVTEEWWLNLTEIIVKVWGGRGEESEKTEVTISKIQGLEQEAMPLDTCSIMLGDGWPRAAQFLGWS
jgi:hypothetical protein